MEGTIAQEVEADMTALVEEAAVVSHIRQLSISDSDAARL